MKSINLSRHFDYIKKLVLHYIPAEVLLVEDINKYLKQIGEELDPTPSIAKARWNSKTGPNRIILKNIFREDDIECSMSAMPFRGIHDAREKIQNSIDFLTHTVLHEVAHIKHDWKQKDENKCDNWAFEQLELIKNKIIKI